MAPKIEGSSQSQSDKEANIGIPPSKRKVNYIESALMGVSPQVNTNKNTNESDKKITFVKVKE